jgi:hypothetical protein
MSEERIGIKESLNSLIAMNLPSEILARRMVTLDCMISALLYYLKDLGLLEEFYNKYPYMRNDLEYIKKGIRPGG